jgi:exonuclease SbcC
MIVAVDNNINFKLLNQMFNSYVNNDIDKENFTIENLEKKRSYLISQWNKTRSTLLSKKEQEKQLVSNCIIKLNERKESLKGLSNHIKQQKNQYVTKIISDIQILFYIYSGRILQDNYFGRGLFIKPDLDRKRILFVSGNYQNNDVDALYHMSSGQLVAVAISFMLALNRLYSTNNIIAIDDPIQTIDDINFWGLMETLRHEFKDHFMLLSTHETNYEQLLDYKFRKIGIQSELINTADLHNNQNSVDSY